jgi:hypothetical protein
MRSITNHTMAFGRAFTLVFFLASSGFGAVVHICVIDASECYDTSDSSHHDACPIKQRPLDVAAICIHHIHGCHKSAIVAGSNLFQSLEERDTKPQKVKVLAQLSSASVSPSSEHAGTRSTRCLSESASPRSVELYQLNATLLI